MSLYAMNNIDNRRAIREALAWRGMSFLEAASEIDASYTPEDIVQGRVGLWKIMAVTGASEEQMYEWGRR